MFGRLTSMKMMVRLVEVKIEGEEEKKDVWAGVVESGKEYKEVEQKKRLTKRLCYIFTCV